MRPRNNRQHQRGFTVQEMLLVILISVILLSVSLVGIVTYLRHLQIQELDNGAREIFLAAQNRAILLSGGQRLEGYVVQTGESNKIEHVDVIPGSDETTQITVYYIHSDDTTALDQLLPQGTIDPTLREGDFYIVYEPESASVVDVFYSDDELPVEDDNFPDFYDQWRAADKELRMDNRPMIGYYGGEAAESGGTLSLRTPVINIHNDNELTVEVTYWVPRILTMTVEGDKVELDVDLTYQDEAITLEKTSENKAESLDIFYFTYTYTWTLDSLEDGKQFQDLLALEGESLTYGGDFTISAEVSYEGTALKVNGARKTATDNSLFAKDSGGETAYISCLRHLQNLDKTFSGVAGKTAAEQRADIQPVEDYTFQPVNNAELKSYDGQDHTIDDLTIRANTTTGNTGLFGKLEGTETDHKTLKNIKLVNATVTGGTENTGVLVGAGEYLTLTNCQVYWENRSEQTTNLREVLGDSATGIHYQVNGGTGPAGGLAGELTNTTITNSFASTLVKSTGPVGGLVGTGSGLTIERSYGANYLGGSQAGGLVGNLTDTANITASYAVGFIDSDSDTNNGTAAGLCLGRGHADVDSSYSAMLFTQGATNYPLCQSGTYTQTHYLQSDYINQGVENETNGLSYSDLIDRSKWDGLFGDDIFTAKTNSQSHPYNLQTTLLLNTYNYPGLADLDHWGDWGAQFQDGSLVYYEKYDDKTYAFAGYIRQDADAVVVEDGYAVAYRGTESTASIAITLTVSYKGGTATKVYEKTDMYVVANVKDVNGKTDTYYLLPLPSQVVNTKYASDEFYQTITIRDTKGSDEGSTKTYSYNPHFANTILDEGDQAKLDQLRVEVRSPRHLYQLSLHEEYYNSNHQYRFLQQLDLDYTQYEWTKYFEENVTTQPPIGVGQDLFFRGNYYGNCHKISGVQVQVERTGSSNGVPYTYVGLFGYTTGVLQDVVYQMPDEEVPTITSTGSSMTRYVGGLVGYNGGTITNCAAYNVQLKAEGYQYSTLYLGGLVGRNAGAIRRSAAEGAAITAAASQSHAYAGGLVGINENVGSVDQCYAVGKVSVSRARYGTVYACGFAGRSEGTIRRSYAAVGLTVSGEANRFGFCPDRTTACVYLNGGNFTYREEHYAAQYEDSAAQGVTWAQLTGTEANEAVSALNMSKVTVGYPYPTALLDGQSQPVHYGQWPDAMNLGTMGVYYWEKLTIGETDSYHFSAISYTEDSQVVKSGTLSTAHGDGGVVTEYGYGYFYEADSVAPTLSSEGLYWDAKWDAKAFNTNSAQTNEEANEKLAALMGRRYTFHSYNTWQAAKNKGLHLIVTEDNKSSTQPPVATWTLNGTFAVKLNPFFADAMSYGDSELPGTADNPYQVRSIEQLQFINWYAWGETKSVNRVAAPGGGEGYLFLNNWLTNGGSRQYSWVQTHDLDGSHIEGYTPIAALHDPPNKENEQQLGKIIAWFSGSYNGNDYTIQEVNISTHNVNTTGLFGVTVNAELKNIVLYSPSGKATITAHNNDKNNPTWYAVGGLVGLAANVGDSNRSIENCAVAGYIIQDKNETCAFGGGGVGGLVGICNMALKNCTAVTNIQLAFQHSDSSRNVRVGGLAGSCQQSITNCYSGGRITLGEGFNETSDSSLHVGGITGGYFMKTLAFADTTVPAIAAGVVLKEDGTQSNQVLSENVTKFYNCYTYVDVVEAVRQECSTRYVIGGLGEISQQGSTNNHIASYQNCYYLSNQKDTGALDASAQNVTNCTYQSLSEGDAFNALTDEKVGFQTVTTETVNKDPLNGRYSFGNDPSLLGKDYPFPTILTQTSDVAPDGIANVHYGDWPLEGIRRPDGALPVNLDLFADYEQDKEGAVHTETLTLSGVSGGGTWSASSADGEGIVKAEINDGNLTITAQKAGNTTVTVTYTLDDKTYSLTIEVNVTAQLLLAVASGVNTPVTVFPNATVSTPLALTDWNGTVLSDALKEKLALDSIDVEFDPDYFANAAVEQDEANNTLTLAAASDTQTGPTQMTVAYDFTYLGKEYSATSVLSLRVVDAEVEVKPLTIALDGAEKKSQEYTGRETEEFTIRVSDSNITVTDLQIVAFEEVVAEYKDIIWAEWAKDENDTQISGTLSVTAYEQDLYPAYASVRIQYQFTYQGSTHTMWQDLVVEVKEETEVVMP